MPDPVELPSYTEGPAQPEPVYVPTDSNNIPLPPDIAKQRAQKAAAGGIGEIVGKDVDQLTADFSAGREKDIRDQAAATIDVQRQRSKQDQLTAMAQKYGPLSANQVSQFLDPFAPQNANTDPDTVIEKQYAHSVIGTLATAPGFLMTDNIMDVARRQIPKQASETEDLANDLVTKNQYLLKKLQEAQLTASNQSWSGWAVDQVKDLSQIYGEYKQRGLVDGLYGVGLLGSNLDEQSNALYRKPLGEFKSTVDAAAAYLTNSNPGLAVSFLAAMQGQDTFEKTVNNIYTMLAVPDLALGGKLVKKVLTYNEIRTAARDIVTAAAREPDHNSAHLVAATGDTQESATLSVARQVTDAMAGHANPLQTSKDTLLTGWKETEGKYKENPGTYLSREAQTRYLDETAKEGVDLINRISTMSRVERQPQSVTSADAIRAYKDKIKQDFRGPDAMLLDVDGPHIEPVSNTKWYVKKLGDYDGSLFTDSATAEGRMQSLKIAGTVEGKAADKLYIPQVAAKDLESIKNTEQGTKFYIKNGIEVQASPTPKPGMVPYNLKTNKFEPTLTGETAHVEQQGLGFYIEHWIPMQETNDTSRNFMIRDRNGNYISEAVSNAVATGTKSIINSVLGRLRNSDETLAVQESAQRKAATYAQTNIHRWAAALNQPINKIQSKASWWKPTAYIGRVSNRDVQAQFEMALNAARQNQRWFKGPGELQDYYQRNFRRDPSALETKAYFNYVKLIEGDRILGEISEFRYRARVGAEQHRIRLIGPDGKPIYSDMFDGVSLTRLPSNDDNIFIVGDDKGKGGRIQETGRLNKKSRDEIEGKLSRGEAKLVEVYDIDHQPLDNFSEVTRDQRIRYVLSKNLESNPLEFNHVNKKEGGHFEWDYDHFIKQADMRPQSGGKHIYVGDRTVMPIDSKALGDNVVKLWNEAHDLMKAGGWEDVRPIAAKLGIPYQDFISWYKSADGRRPKLNFHEPMVVVPKNKTVLSLDSALQDRYRFKDKDGNFINRFEDGSRTGFANNFKVAYNTERHSDFNFRTINDTGSKENPLYQYQPAKLVDPLPTMNRALNRAISSAFMDDYKLYAIEHWLREAETHLEADGGINSIRSAPFWYYHDPKFKASTPVNVKWNLLNNKYKIDSFIGIPSKFDTWVHTFTQHLADVAYINYGPEEARTGLQKAKTIVPIWLLQHVTNPVDFIRSATFNFKLGLFNPAQFLVQAQTHALIWSLEPRHGTVGTFGMLLHGWSRVNKNPAILRSLDDYYTKLNMFGSNARPGEFLEAMKELDNTGFEHVAGEYANLAKSYLPTTNFLGGDVGRGLKIGQTPFRLGEQSTRITAWYTAFRKFREANPTTPITNIDRNKILQHADLLTVNMSRASNSMINHGAFALSTQFLNYQIRLAELFLGSRTSMMEKARIMTGFSILYGFPNAFGVTGAPISDNLREHFMDDLGYIPGEKWTSTMLNEGFPAWTWAMITGKGDLQAGNMENVGNRFGSQGFQNIKQALRSDIPWYMAIGGAGVSTMSNFVGAALDPFYQGAMSWARGDTGDSRFTIKGADLIQPFKEISSFENLGVKWWTAMETGKWINKNEGYVEDISPLRATYLSVLGMNPQSQDDMFIKNSIIKGEEEAQKAAQKGATKDWQRGIQAFASGDPDQGNAYVKNAMARLTAVGYPYEETLKFMATASKGWESTIDQSDFSYWTRGDQTKRQQRFDYVQREQAMKDKQKP